MPSASCLALKNPPQSLSPPFPVISSAKIMSQSPTYPKEVSQGLTRET